MAAKNAIKKELDLTFYYYGEDEGILWRLFIHPVDMRQHEHSFRVVFLGSIVWENSLAVVVCDTPFILNTVISSTVNAAQSSGQQVLVKLIWWTCLQTVVYLNIQQTQSNVSVLFKFILNLYPLFWSPPAHEGHIWLLSSYCKRFTRFPNKSPTVKVGEKIWKKKC